MQIQLTVTILLFTLAVPLHSYLLKLNSRKDYGNCGGKNKNCIVPYLTICALYLQFFHILV